MRPRARALASLGAALPLGINCGWQFAQPTQKSRHLPNVFIGKHAIPAAHAGILDAALYDDKRLAIAQLWRFICKLWNGWKEIARTPATRSPRFTMAAGTVVSKNLEARQKVTVGDGKRVAEIGRRPSK